jgi:hypothetical protein
MEFIGSHHSLPELERSAVFPHNHVKARQIGSVPSADSADPTLLQLTAKSFSCPAAPRTDNKSALTQSGMAFG